MCKKKVLIKCKRLSLVVEVTNSRGLLLPGVIVVKAVCLDCDLCFLAVLTVLRVMLPSDLEELLVAEGDLVLALAFLGRGGTALGCTSCSPYLERYGEDTVIRCILFSDRHKCH